MAPWLNWIEQPPPKGQVTGSNPVGVTRLLGQRDEPAFGRERSRKSALGSRRDHPRKRLPKAGMRGGNLAPAPAQFATIRARFSRLNSL